MSLRQEETSRYDRREDDLHILVPLLVRRENEGKAYYTRRELAVLLQWGHARIGMAFTMAAATRHIRLERRSYNVTEKAQELARRVWERRRFDNMLLLGGVKASELCALEWGDVEEREDGSFSLFRFGGRTGMSATIVARDGGVIATALRLQRSEQIARGAFDPLHGLVFPFGGVV